LTSNAELLQSLMSAVTKICTLISAMSTIDHID